MERGGGKGGTNVVVDCCDQYGADHEKPVYKGDVELAVEFCGCVDDFDLREV